MTRRRLLTWVVLIAALGAGCGVRPSGVISGGPAPTGPVEGVVLYFLADSTLTPVLRHPRDRLSPTRALELLQEGPDHDERAANVTTEVPTELDPVTVTSDAASGTVDVVVSADVTTLSTPAVDQIVCTVREAMSTTAPVTLTSDAATRGPRTCPLTVESRPRVPGGVVGKDPPPYR